MANKIGFRIAYEVNLPAVWLPGHFNSDPYLPIVFSFFFFSIGHLTLKRVGHLVD